MTYYLYFIIHVLNGAFYPQEDADPLTTMSYSLPDEEDIVWDEKVISQDIIERLDEQIAILWNAADLEEDICLQIPLLLRLGENLNKKEYMEDILRGKYNDNNNENHLLSLTLSSSLLKFKFKLIKRYQYVVDFCTQHQHLPLLMYRYANLLSRINLEENADTVFGLLNKNHPKSIYSALSYYYRGEYALYKLSNFKLALNLFKHAERSTNTKIHFLSLYQQAWCYINLKDFKLSKLKFKNLITLVNNYSQSDINYSFLIQLKEDSIRDYIRSCVLDGMSAQQILLEIENNKSIKEKKIFIAKAIYFYEIKKDFLSANKLIMYLSYKSKNEFSRLFYHQKALKNMIYSDNILTLKPYADFIIKGMKNYLCKQSLDLFNTIEFSPVKLSVKDLTFSIETLLRDMILDSKNNKTKKYSKKNKSDKFKVKLEYLLSVYLDIFAKNPCFKQISEIHKNLIAMTLEQASVFSDKNMKNKSKILYDELKNQFKNNKSLLRIIDYKFIYDLDGEILLSRKNKSSKDIKIMPESVKNLLKYAKDFIDKYKDDQDDEGKDLIDFVYIALAKEYYLYKDFTNTETYANIVLQNQLSDNRKRNAEFIKQSAFFLVKTAEFQKKPDKSIMILNQLKEKGELKDKFLSTKLVYLEVSKKIDNNKNKFLTYEENKENADYFLILYRQHPQEKYSPILLSYAAYYLDKIGKKEESNSLKKELISKFPNSDEVLNLKYKKAAALEAQGRFNEAANEYLNIYQESSEYKNIQDVIHALELLKSENNYKSIEKYVKKINLKQEHLNDKLLYALLSICDWDLTKDTLPRKKTTRKCFNDIIQHMHIYQNKENIFCAKIALDLYDESEQGISSLLNKSSQLKKTFGMLESKKNNFCYNARAIFHWKLGLHYEKMMIKEPLPIMSQKNKSKIQKQIKKINELKQKSIHYFMALSKINSKLFNLALMHIAQLSQYYAFKLEHMTINDASSKISNDRSFIANLRYTLQKKAQPYYQESIKLFAKCREHAQKHFIPYSAIEPCWNALADIKKIFPLLHWHGAPNTAIHPSFVTSYLPYPFFIGIKDKLYPVKDSLLCHKNESVFQ